MLPLIDTFYSTIYHKRNNKSPSNFCAVIHYIWGALRLGLYYLRGREFASRWRRQARHLANAPLTTPAVTQHKYRACRNNSTAVFHTGNVQASPRSQKHFYKRFFNAILSPFGWFIIRALKGA